MLARCPVMHEDEHRHRPELHTSIGDVVSLQMIPVLRFHGSEPDTGKLWHD